MKCSPIEAPAGSLLIMILFDESISVFAETGPLPLFKWGIVISCISSKRILMRYAPLFFNNIKTRCDNRKGKFFLHLYEIVDLWYTVSYYIETHMEPQKGETYEK